MDKRTEQLIKSVLSVKNLDEAKVKKQLENNQDAVHAEAIPEDEIARQFQEDKETFKSSDTINDSPYDSELLDRKLPSDRENNQFSLQLGDDEIFSAYGEWKDYVKEICFQVNKSFLAYIYNNKRKMFNKEDT